MSKFPNLYKAFSEKMYSDLEQNLIYLEFDQENNLFWLVWADDITYDQNKLKG